MSAQNRPSRWPPSAKRNHLNTTNALSIPKVPTSRRTRVIVFMLTAMVLWVTIHRRVIATVVPSSPQKAKAWNAITGTALPAMPASWRISRRSCAWLTRASGSGFGRRRTVSTRIIFSRQTGHKNLTGSNPYR